MCPFYTDIRKLHRKPYFTTRPNAQLLGSANKQTLCYRGKYLLQGNEVKVHPFIFDIW